MVVNTCGPLRPSATPRGRVPRPYGYARRCHPSTARGAEFNPSPHPMLLAVRVQAKGKGASEASEADKRTATSPDGKDAAKAPAVGTDGQRVEGEGEREGWWEGEAEPG